MKRSLIFAAAVFCASCLAAEVTELTKGKSHKLFKVRGKKSQISIEVRIDFRHDLWHNIAGNI